MIRIFTKVIILEKVVNIVEMVLLIVYVEIAILCSIGKGCLFVAVYCCEMLSNDQDYQENERNCSYQSVVIYNSYSANSESSLNGCLV